jgi:hypothetical protein
MNPQERARRPEPPRHAYPARVLERPVVDARGVRHGPEDERQELGWSRIVWAIAAEVGEPQGVRTIVFDLVARAGQGLRVLRVDAEPGEDAMALARAVAAGLGDARKIPSIRSLATDGIPARWYPDLHAFEQDAEAELAELPVR